MADLNNSSVGPEVELVEAKRLTTQLQVQLEAKDAQIETLKGLHEADLRKLNMQVKNLSEQLEEVVKQKIEGDKRHQTLIDQLGVKNKNLTIELNNTIQKYQLELQKQRGSFAKRSSVIAVAMLNKLSNPGAGLEDRSARPSRLTSPPQRQSADAKSTKGTPKDSRPNPFKESTLPEEPLKRHTFGSNPQPTPTENDPAVDERTENSVSDDRSAVSFTSANKHKESPENIEEMIRQIAPSLPGLGVKAAPDFNMHQGEILKIIEELQYLLKCEEIEKKQILDEHTKALETIAVMEHGQVDFGCKLFALEREKVEALHQVDVYKSMATEYETKWKELMMHQSKIEVKMSEIRSDKALDQGELELLRAEVAGLKAKTCDLQLQLNERDFLETENYRENQRAKMALEQQSTEKEETIKLMKNELAKMEAEKRSLVTRLQDMEKDSHQAHFKVAKAEEMELQYTAMIQGLNQTIEKLSKELAVHGVNGGGEALENVSEERLAFSEHDSIDQAAAQNPALDRMSHSSLMHNSRHALAAGSNRSASAERQKEETESLKNHILASRGNSVDNRSTPDPETGKPSQQVRKSGRTSLVVTSMIPSLPSTTLPDNGKRPSSSKLETRDTFSGLPAKPTVEKQTTDIAIFSLRKRAEKRASDADEKVAESRGASKNDQSLKVGSDKRHSLVSGSKEAIAAINSRRQSVRAGMDIVNALGGAGAADMIKKRMEELQAGSVKEAEWEKSKTELQEQLQKLSSDLNARIEESFSTEKALRTSEAQLQALQEDLRMKNLQISQLEQRLASLETESAAETRKLREQLDEVTGTLVDFKLRCNDLQSKADIERARLQKQIKIRDYELDILRREIYKFNTNTNDE